MPNINVPAAPDFYSNHFRSLQGVGDSIGQSIGALIMARKAKAQRGRDMTALERFLETGRIEDAPQSFSPEKIYDITEDRRKEMKGDEADYMDRVYAADLAKQKIQAGIDERKRQADEQYAKDIRTREAADLGHQRQKELIDYRAATGDEREYRKAMIQKEKEDIDRARQEEEVSRILAGDAPKTVKGLNLKTWMNSIGSSTKAGMTDEEYREELLKRATKRWQDYNSGLGLGDQPDKTFEEIVMEEKARMDYVLTPPEPPRTPYASSLQFFDPSRPRQAVAGPSSPAPPAPTPARSVVGGKTYVKINGQWYLEE